MSRVTHSEPGLPMVKAAVLFNPQTNTNLLFKLDCLFSFLRELKKASVKNKHDGSEVNIFLTV